jgi:hypothetical protein
MATESYMVGRKKYFRPQALLFANNPGYISNGKIVPDGEEFRDFIILSDDNRGSIDIAPERIEKRERMINGRMRSYHIADKLELSTSWDMIPSRSFASSPEFDENGEPEDLSITGEQYTTDGGAGGLDLLNWYNSYKGSFFVYLAYDKYTNFPDDENRYSRLGQYNEILEMYISNFTYSVEKRGRSNYDFWSISVSLEEV